MTCYREIERKKEDGQPKRGDMFHVKIHREEQDKSKTFTFKNK